MEIKGLWKNVGTPEIEKLQDAVKEKSFTTEIEYHTLESLLTSGNDKVWFEVLVVKNKFNIMTGNIFELY